MYLLPSDIDVHTIHIDVLFWPTPTQVKDAVSSPGGTTIYGLQCLENGSYRGSLTAAVKAAADRAQEMDPSRKT